MKKYVTATTPTSRRAASDNCPAYAISTYSPVTSMMIPESIYRILVAAIIIDLLLLYTPDADFFLIEDSKAVVSLMPLSGFKDKIRA